MANEVLKSVLNDRDYRLRWHANWLERSIVQGYTEDGRCLVFPVSELSHLTNATSDDTIDESIEATPNTKDPMYQPASVVLKTGARYRMAEPLVAWMNRIATARENAGRAITGQEPQ